MKIISILSNLTKNRYSNLLEKQNFHIYMYAVPLTLSSSASTLLGIGGPQDTIFKYLVSANIIVTITSIILNILRKYKISQHLAAIIITVSLETSAEMIYSSYQADSYYHSLILANISILMLGIVISIVSYIRHLSTFLSLTSLATYIFCTINLGCPILYNFLPVMVSMFLITAIIGHQLIRNFNKLHKENIFLKEKESNLMEMLHLDSDQIKAYMRLASHKELHAEETDTLLHTIGQDAKDNIYRSVSAQMIKDRTDARRLEECLPELTPSELEICKHILRGKKHSEICALTHRSSSTVTSTRAHIRAKLKLKKEENLTEALRSRTGIYS